MEGVGVASGSVREGRYRELLGEWRRLVPARVGPDEPRIRAMNAEAGAIRADGRWTAGPADLMTVLGRSRDELFHSRVLAWLLDPVGRHGLGDRFLRALLATAFPKGFPYDGGLVEVETEVARAGESSVTGELLESRADLVVHLDAATIVIENKVDAGEQPAQCERLYWSWRDAATDVRWIFLTPSGRAPASSSSEAARSAWRTLAYADVERCLAAVLGEAGPLASVGRATAAQYLATLAAHRRR